MCIRDSLSVEEKEQFRAVTQAKIVDMIKKETDPAFVDAWLGAIKDAEKDVKAGI